MSVSYKDVRSFTEGRLQSILKSSNEARQKASLANLRRGVGKIPGELPELMGELLTDMPEEMFGKSEPSRAEWAVYTALTLFALHQQGHDPKTEPMHRQGEGLGTAAAKLIGNENDEERVRNRFNITAMSSDMAELANHLRGLVQLLKGKGIPLDYAALASDLYLYQFPSSRDSVRLKWGQDFYGFNRKDDKNEKQ